MLRRKACGFDSHLDHEGEFQPQGGNMAKLFLFLAGAPLLIAGVIGLLNDTHMCFVGYPEQVLMLRGLDRFGFNAVDPWSAAFYWLFPLLIGACCFLYLYHFNAPIPPPPRSDKGPA